MSKKVIIRKPRKALISVYFDLDTLAIVDDLALERDGNLSGTITYLVKEGIEFRRIQQETNKSVKTKNKEVKKK